MMIACNSMRRAAGEPEPRRGGAITECSAFGETDLRRKRVHRRAVGVPLRGWRVVIVGAVCNTLYVKFNECRAAALASQFGYGVVAAGPRSDILQQMQAVRERNPNVETYHRLD